MKNIIPAFALLFCVCSAFAQDVPKSTVTTTGTAQKILYPMSYKLRFFLQEEVKGQNQKGIIKTSLDSIMAVFFENIKAYGFKESDFSILKKSSTGNGGRPYYDLYSILYELKNQKFSMAQKFVNDMRFVGLKGIVAKPVYPIITPVVQDSLFKSAISDAYSNASNLAKQVNKSVGEVYNINSGNSNNVLRDFSNDYDPIDPYNSSKFELSMIDNKVYTVTINVTYQIKR